MTRPGLLARLLSAIVLSIPLGYLIRAMSARRHHEMATDPSGFLRHQERLYHPHLGYHVVVLGVMLCVLVLALEGLALVVARVLPAGESAP